MEEKKFVKPCCPQCGRYNIRHRSSSGFADKPFHCNLCGHDWKEEPKE